MSKQSDPTAVASATSAPDPVHPATPAQPPDRAHWTPAKQRIFLAALSENGSVAGAARLVGMSRSSAHRLRRRLAGTPFDRDWERAVAVHLRRMADPFGAAPTPPARPQPAPRVAGAAQR